MQHRDGMRLKVPDWDKFRDPDQLTYRKYVTCQDNSETYIDGIINEFARLGGAGRAPDFLRTCLTPSRYLAHGLQMVSAYLQQLAPSSYVGNCAAFQTADHLRRVQRVAYRTKQLARQHPGQAFGEAERALWERMPEWQGLRKAVEYLFVSFDWDDAFAGLNLVIKPLADEITLRQFAAVARHAGSDLDAMMADNLFLDAERSRRWTTALTRFAIAENAGNRERLEVLVAKWRPFGDEIIESGSGLFAPFVSGTDLQGQIAAAVADAWRDFLGQAGLALK
jgi:toluene monooxygenase system protein E